jgi:hypothetical protein
VSDDRSAPSSPPERPLRPRSWDRQPAPPPPFDPTAGRPVLGPAPPGLAPPRSARDRTPVDRLSTQARSVVVPAVVAVLLILVTPVVVLLSLVVTLRDADLGAGGSAVDRYDECQSARREIRDDIEAFQARTGRVPAGDDDLPAYDRERFAVDYTRARPSPQPVPGGPCDLTVRVGTGTTTVHGPGAEDDGFRSLAEALTFDEPLQLVAAGLGGTAMGALAWWLACAHRCLPTRDRTVDPSRAYGPVWVLGAGFVASSFVQGLALASGGDAGGSLMVFYLWVATSLAVGLAMVKTLRTSADMIGDITHALAGGHAPTRLMQAALTTILWALGVALVSTVLAIGAAPLLAVAGLATVVVWLAALVALVAYGIAVIMATVAIERSLGEAAAQLDAEDAAALAAL